MNLLKSVVIGLGATLCIDMWSIFLRRALGVQSLDYCLLGRWLLHMPTGRIVHSGIKSSSPRRGECGLGWAAHYTIGAGFAIVFVLMAPVTWLAQPALLPALAFGMGTVVVPFFTLQPSFGLGIASSKTPHPAAARLKSVTTHTVFGAGLYVAAEVISRW